MVDEQTRKIMLKALETGLGFKPGQRVALIGQSWNMRLPQETRNSMGKAMNLWSALKETYQEAGITLFPHTYNPIKEGSTVEPPQPFVDFFEQGHEPGRPIDIILAPTAYSLTHTDFMKAQAARGSRIATMSNSSLAMFAPGGPFDSQESSEDTVRRTNDIADQLRETEYVDITGPNAELRIHVNPKLVHTSTGIITTPGEIGNWLGAEAYAVPVDPRDGEGSNGWLKVEASLGGRDQLQYGAIFRIASGRFAEIEALDKSNEAQRWLDENVAPRMLPEYGAPENHDIVAELGFGTNTAISRNYLRRNWSIAVGEKAYAFDGKRTVHVASGNSSGMGGRNNVKHHEDWLIEDAAIEFN